MKKTKKTISAKDAVVRVERGWAGHFCAASNCRFRRNTLLECWGERIVVSTVGDCHFDDRSDPHEIGCDRYYETMAFRAKLDGPYWDADVQQEIHFESKWSIDHCKPGADNEANDMHEAVVAELTERLLKGLKTE